MTDTEAVVELARERLVRRNLEARIGALIGENLDLLARLYEYEHPDRNGDGGGL